MRCVPTSKISKRLPAQRAINKETILIHSSWQTLAGREFFSVTIAGKTTGAAQQESRTAMEAALRAIESAGFSAQNLVRSRLFARDAHVRRIASDVRLDVLTGALMQSGIGAQRSCINP